MRKRKYEIVNLEIQGIKMKVCFTDTSIFRTYISWLRFLATIKKFGYKAEAV